MSTKEPPAPTLRLEGVSVPRGGRPVVREVSVSVPPGEVTTALTPMTSLPSAVLRGLPLSYSLGWKSTFARRPTVQSVGFALKYASPHVPGNTTDGEEGALCVGVLHAVPGLLIHLVHGVVNLCLCSTGRDTNSGALNECIEPAPFCGGAIHESFDRAD